MGLLGFWGEWHTYPHEDWFAPKATQNRVLQAYFKAFKKTKLLMRYPTADGVRLPIGFHDDSFAYSTLPTIDWHFLAQMHRTKMTNRWKTAPIGGELRPEVQSFIWKHPLPKNKKYENFDQCVAQTHCSWLINQYVFSNQLPQLDFERALKGAQLLGYDLHVSNGRVGKSNNRIVVTAKIENRGIAPIYYDWPVELLLSYSKDGRTHVVRGEANWSLSKILPGQARSFSYTFDFVGAKRNLYSVTARIPNPINRSKRRPRDANRTLAKPVRFANKRCEKNGRLLLGRLDIGD